MVSSEFEAAAEATKQFTVKPSQDDLLQLYGLFKQATQSPPYDKADKPGMFDLKGKAKYGAWTKVKDLAPEEAEKEYITLVESFKTKYKYDADKQPEQVGA